MRVLGETREVDQAVGQDRFNGDATGPGIRGLRWRKSSLTIDGGVGKQCLVRMQTPK